MSPAKYLRRIKGMQPPTRDHALGLLEALSQFDGREPGGARRRDQLIQLLDDITRPLGFTFADVDPEEARHA